MLALFAAFVAAPVALAHTTLLRVEPPDGAMLDTAPSEVRLWFSEPIALGLTTIELTDSDGRRIPVTARLDAASQALALRSGTAGEAALVVDLPRLAPNAYRLSWRTMSGDDLHAVAGTVVFGIGRAPDQATPAAVTPSISAVEVALRWLDRGALATLVGALAVRALAATAGRRPLAGGIRTRSAMSRAILRLALGSALLAVVAEIGLLLAQAIAAGDGMQQGSLAGRLWRIALETGFGTRWLVGQGLLITLAAALFVLHALGPSRPWAPRATHARAPVTLSLPYAVRRPPHTCPHSLHLAAPEVAPLSEDPGAHTRLRPIIWALVAALLPAIITLRALNSHAAAFIDISPVLVAASALHSLAAGVWAGGVLALAVAVTPLLRRDAADAALAWEILRRFGALAAAALGGLLVTGLFMSGQQVASLDALLTTWYGQALLLKIALALVAAVLGLRNAAALHPPVAALLREVTHWPRQLRPAVLHYVARRPAGSRSEPARAVSRGPRRLALTIAAEAGGALLVVLLAAVLGATPPARGPEFDPSPATASGATASVDDLVVTLAVKPNRPGRNFIDVGVLNTRRPPPAPIETVLLELRAPGEHADRGLLVAERLDEDHYHVAGDLLRTAGDWQISVIVRRAGMPDATTTMPWKVLPALAARPVWLSNQPLAQLLTPAAAALAVVLGAAALALRLRRHSATAITFVQSYLVRCFRSLPEE
ncbi:MAG TPA: copper resistance protein CopC [Roseiflexaceae bacterium]|nr:copper resistance protein CopC [Roseiflexaceae bacterium]